MEDFCDVTAVFERGALSFPLHPETALAELAERLSAVGADGRHGALTYVAVRLDRSARRAA
jgi:hypothetical protein